MSKQEDKIMNELLELYDWYIRLATLDAEDYVYGYADAIAQSILNVGKALGESSEPYKHEAYRRVMNYSTTAEYWEKYPKPLAPHFPADVIRKNGGEL